MGANFKVEVGTKIRKTGESSRYFTKGKVYEVVRLNDGGFIATDNESSEHHLGYVYASKHFELVTPKQKKSERITNAEQAIVELRAELDAVKAQLVESQAKAEAQVKVGNFVKNVSKVRTYLTIDKVYEVIRIDNDGDFWIIDDNGDERFLTPNQCEKVAKPIAEQAEQTQYKVGDVVIVGGEVRVIVFVEDSRVPIRTVRVGRVGEELVPYWHTESEIKCYATAEEIASVGK